MPQITEWQMWRQLKGAFTLGNSANFRLVFVPICHKLDGYTFDQYETEEEAIDSLAEGTQVCFLESSGFKSMYDLPSLQDDVALVLGNAHHSNMNTLTVPPEAYSIRTANKTALFGTNAAAIALAFMAGQ